VQVARLQEASKNNGIKKGRWFKTSRELHGRRLLGAVGQGWAVGMSAEVYLYLPPDLYLSLRRCSLMPLDGRGCSCFLPSEAVPLAWSFTVVLRVASASVIAGGHCRLLTVCFVCCTEQDRKRVIHGHNEEVYTRANQRLASGQTGTAPNSMAKYDDRWSQFENWMIEMDPYHPYTRRILRIEKGDTEACLEPFAVPLERLVEYLEFLCAGHRGKHPSVGQVDYMFSAGSGRDLQPAFFPLPPTVAAAAVRVRAGGGLGWDAGGGSAAGGASGSGSTGGGGGDQEMEDVSMDGEARSLMGIAEGGGGFGSTGCAAGGGAGSGSAGGGGSGGTASGGGASAGTGFTSTTVEGGGETPEEAQNMAEDAMFRERRRRMSTTEGRGLAASALDTFVTAAQKIFDMFAHEKVALRDNHLVPPLPTIKACTLQHQP